MTHRPFNKKYPFGTVTGTTDNNVRYTQGGVDYDNECKPCAVQSQPIEPFNPNVVLAQALGSADSEAEIEAEVQSRLAAALEAAGVSVPTPEKDPEPQGKVVASKTTVMVPEKMDSDQLKAAVEFKGGVFTNRKAALKFLASE